MSEIVSVVLREEPPKKPKKEPMWNPALDASLKVLYNESDITIDWDSISKELGRTVHACRVRVADIMTPEEQLEYKASKLNEGSVKALIESLRRECDECRSSVFYTPREWSGTHLCDECYQSHWSKRQRLWDQVPTGPCVFCGKRYPQMQLDHLNMFDKGDSICSMISRGDPIEAILEEASKCQVRSFHCLKTSRD